MADPASVGRGPRCPRRAYRQRRRSAGSPRFAADLIVRVRVRRAAGPLAKKKKSGRKNDQRNWEIILAAKSLRGLGLRLTRNRVSRDAGNWQSAASLIAGWLGMSEDAVDKILQRSEHLLPGVT